MRAILIGQTNIDFPKFFLLMKELTGESWSTKMDQAGLKPSNSSMVYQLGPKGLALISYTMVIVCDDVTVLDILSSSLQSLHTETRKRQIYGVIVSGTLDQWRDAIAVWQQSENEDTIATAQECLAILAKEGLKPVISGTKGLR